MKEEDDCPMDTDGSDNEASGVTACVTSSTNGNGQPTSTASVITTHRRLPDPVALGKAFIKFGEDIAAGTAPASLLSEATTSHLSSILDRAKRSSLDRASSNKSSGSDGSNSASPLSLMGTSSGPGRSSSRRGVRPRAADSPGSGSTTSTTTVGQGGARERNFVCPICERSFGYKHVLQNHERTHTGEKPFECKECKKRFTRDHHLKTHMRLHTGEKPYNCHHCDRQFVQVANLRRHLRVHTGERPYQCTSCDSKFSDSNQLKAHVLIHNGEKPFPCGKCGGRYRRRHHLIHHKCPRDEANIGRPRRGRRPRAYDDSGNQPFGLPVSLSPSAAIPSLAVSSTTMPNAASLFNPALLAGISPLLNAISLRNSAVTADDSGRDAFRSDSPPPAHSASSQRRSSSSSNTVAIHKETGNNSNNKSRRKPQRTVRILPDEERYLLERDNTGIQTQPLNLEVAKTASEVLDLSRKSDADSDVDINEDRNWKDEDDDDEEDFCDEYDDDEDPQDLSNRGAASATGNGNSGRNGFHASYHNNSGVKYRTKS